MLRWVHPILSVSAKSVWYVESIGKGNTMVIPKDFLGSCWGRSIDQPRKHGILKSAAVLSCFLDGSVLQAIPTTLKRLALASVQEGSSKL